MTTSRILHTATLLPDGRVLIAGGVIGSYPSITATAELYDPLTGMFATTGEMNAARRSHTATLLPDGRVLIAGGHGPVGLAAACQPSTCGELASAELYDPATGTFAPTGDMIAGGNASGGGKAILLQNGKVLVAVNLTAQLYEPVTGAFTATGPYADQTFGVYTATMLADGKVLLTGCGGTSCDAGVTEVYDPGTDTFSLTGPMSEWYSVNTATLLMNGKVLFVGNAENFPLPAEAEVYDPATGTFSAGGDTVWPHESSTATLVGDGTVLIAGASGARAELYDPVLGTFSPTASMVTARHGHTAILLRDSRVLLTGGVNDSGGWIFTAELYVP